MICGLIGWCMECFWTGMAAIKEHKDKKLICTTSVWMFPIYGMAALVAPLSRKIQKWNTVARGGIYTIVIFMGEFATGSVLKHFHACPWDYSKAKTNIKGIIRLDYAPLWFLSGLFFEKIMGKNKSLL